VAVGYLWQYLIRGGNVTAVKERDLSIHEWNFQLFFVE
jgi:hypothetical protein